MKNLTSPSLTAPRGDSCLGCRGLYGHLDKSPLKDKEGRKVLLVSQSCRNPKSWWEGAEEGPHQPPEPELGAQSPVPPGFVHVQGRDPTATLGTSSTLTSLAGITFKQNFLYFVVCPLPLVLFWAPLKSLAQFSCP